MSPSDAAAWLAAALVPVTAGLAWYVRKWGRGSFIARIRPHLVLGYLILGLAIAHAVLSAGNSVSANDAGIWLAILALAGLGLQAFSGANLQSPGSYRLVLRRWHTALFWTIALLALGHVVLNG